MCVSMLHACQIVVTARLSVLRARRYGELLLAMHNTLQATSEWGGGAAPPAATLHRLAGWVVYIRLSRNAAQQQRSRQCTRRRGPIGLATP